MYAVDRDTGKGLQALKAKNAHIAQVDVTSPESIQKFKDSLGDTTIDLLLNIAGNSDFRCLREKDASNRENQIGVAAGTEDDSLSSSNLQVFQRTFAVNTFGVFLLTQALLPNVLKSASPKIGIVSSRVGSVGDNSTGNHYAYRSSKAAVNSIGKSLAVELKEKGVTVMLLHPGFVQTNLLPKAKMPPETVMPDEAARKLWENIVKMIDDTQPEKVIAL